MVYKHNEAQGLTVNNRKNKGKFWSAYKKREYFIFQTNYILYLKSLNFCVFNFTNPKNSYYWQYFTQTQNNGV